MSTRTSRAATKRVIDGRTVEHGALSSAVDAVPAGQWAVGISGGADSVALLSLLRLRADLHLHVAHLDHQTRADQSTGDAEFVRRLADQWRLDCTIELRENIEPSIDSLPVNRSARFRIARLALFGQVVREHRLDGVILAHHADDQAETVLQRLLRGSGPRGLAGMALRAEVGGLLVLRPLLSVRREQLRGHLQSIGQCWREDASNESGAYLRNRLRRWLANEPELNAALLALASACRQLREWVRHEAPELSDCFEVAELNRLPLCMAHESAHRWLLARGAAVDALNESVLDRLVQMALDAGTSPRQHFPGGLLVRRRRGRIDAFTNRPTDPDPAVQTQ